MPATSPPASARERAEAAGQGHLFAHWETLDAAGRERLLAEVGEIDFELVSALAALLRHESGHHPEPEDELGGGELAPPELFPLQRGPEHEARAAEAAARGAELLNAGQVGFLLVAGGQASRLGYDGPKGAFEIGPVSEWSLFELHARRIRAARERHGAAAPWYVMTSRANHAATVAFFEQRAHFGLPPGDVFFFSQSMVPAVDLEGRILMSGPDAVFLAPNGHGGSLAAFASSGALADARRRGVRQLSYFQVDNPLARPADPLFLGLHELEGAGMSSKVVAKRDPDEKVGVLGQIGGRLGCIEYSDLSDELRHARDPGGELTWRAGNIAIHALRLDFVDELTRGRLELPWHVAQKEMQVWGPEGATTVQGAKFETFVFDALGRSERSVTLEVERALEFSPVKNCEGSDSPASCRRDLCRLFAGWVREAGHPLPEVRLQGEPAVEVDPLLAEDRESFLALEAPEPERTERGHLYR